MLTLQPSNVVNGVAYVAILAAYSARRRLAGLFAEAVMGSLVAGLKRQAISEVGR